MRFNLSTIILFIGAVSGVIGVPVAKPDSQTTEISKRSEDAQLVKRNGRVATLLAIWVTLNFVGGLNQREWFPAVQWKPEDVVVKREAQTEEEVLLDEWKAKLREREKEFLRALIEMDREEITSD